MQGAKEGRAVGGPPGPTPGSKPAKPDRGLGFLKEVPILIVIALAIALIIKTFVVQAFYIPSASMENTLLINDRVLVSKFIYDFKAPERGNIVVFVAPAAAFGGTLPPSPAGIAGFFNSLKEAVGLPSSQRIFIKRVVALAGDTVQIKDNALYVNGVRQHEPYLHPPATAGMANFGPVTVPKNHLFVMGDNRADSEDSRIFGPIASSSVVGQAFIRIWPLSRIAFL